MTVYTRVEHQKYTIGVERYADELQKKYLSCPFTKKSPTGFMSEQLKDRLRRLKWLLRSVAGKDIYHRKQINVDIEMIGGIGSSLNGAWPVCPGLLSAEAIVYSVGVGDDISFDRALIARFGVTIHAFDPTPASREWLAKQSLPAQFHLAEIGLADYDGQATFYPPDEAGFVSYSMEKTKTGASERTPVTVEVRRLSTLMSQMGHNHIDLLKIDIEGSEYGVIKDVIASGMPVRQFLIEFHHRMAGFKPEDTNNAIKALNAAGYQIAHITGRGEEYTFIHVP